MLVKAKNDDEKIKKMCLDKIVLKYFVLIVV